MPKLHRRLFGVKSLLKTSKKNCGVPQNRDGNHDAETRTNHAQQAIEVTANDVAAGNEVCWDLYYLASRNVGRQRDKGRQRRRTADVAIVLIHQPIPTPSSKAE